MDMELCKYSGTSLNGKSVINIEAKGPYAEVIDIINMPSVAQPSCNVLVLSHLCEK